ncbi:MAG TPA: tRNA (guanosine(46)-N7)-methyltransferase TrmB, partial [Dermatophilaceae bacterium]|nr:tRNA (guanosine(46)-N7)-methyltransferase TrmB [Dermatophilaceae bacterium]
HKRRLVNPGFAELAASRLAPGGALRLATDWADYARQMRDVLTGCGSLANPYGGDGFAPRFEGRVMTRFEQKALASGSTIYDLELRRSPQT